MRISDKFHKFNSTKLGRQLNYDLTVNLVLTYLAFFFAAGFLFGINIMVWSIFVIICYRGLDLW